MNIFLSIDDTDNHESPGSGQLAELLSAHVKRLGLASNCSAISRHQLYVHEAVRCTSHNSAMCFLLTLAERNKHCYERLTSVAQDFIRRFSAPGSDPGLCIAADEHIGTRRQLIEFGQRAKACLLSKAEAYDLASRSGIHLSEHGGTGDGVIGALAGIGLRMSGNDGRFRGWLRVGTPGRTLSAAHLCAEARADHTIDERGCRLSGFIPVMLADSRIKVVLHNHCRVIPLSRGAEANGDGWSTLTPAESKKF
jgi:hypothetical protein